MEAKKPLICTLPLPSLPFSRYGSDAKRIFESGLITRSETDAENAKSFPRGLNFEFEITWWTRGESILITNGWL